MTDIEQKRRRDQELVAGMIALYCRKKHRGRELCDDCLRLREYAGERSEKCPHMETKTFCSSCKTHCYKPEMREKIRAVMRFSGPRMLLYRPVIVLRHALHAKRRKKNEASSV